MRKVLSQVLFLAIVTFLVSNLFAETSNVLASENDRESENALKSGKVAEVKVKVMTYNLRYENNKDLSPHTWTERLPAIKKLLRKEQPDIIGTQEALYQQLNDLESSLENYNWIGLGREGGSKGEYSAIFYNEKRYSPLEYDHFWLSNTPNVIGSKTWGNNITRMVTWAKFLDKKSKQNFYVVNTHFDHKSENAREKSAELIIEKIKGLDAELPILLTGDFNIHPDSSPYQTLTSEDGFEDLWNTAKVRINENLGTFNGFNDQTGGGPEKRIDWILAKGNVTAHGIEIINDSKNGQFPSDHYPVMADVTLSYLPLFSLQLQN